MKKAKKNKGLEKNKSLLTYRKKRKKVAKASSNPPLGVDFQNYILPGFAAYAGTKFLSRIVYQTIQSKFPKLGKHAAAASAVSAFGAIWYFGHKWDKLRPYHDGIVVGSAIAAMQTIARTYLPAQYNWIVSDYLEPEAQKASAQNQVPGLSIFKPELPEASSGIEGAITTGLGSLSDNSLGLSNESLENIEKELSKHSDDMMSDLGDDDDGLAGFLN